MELYSLNITKNKNKQKCRFECEVIEDKNDLIIKLYHNFIFHKFYSDFNDTYEVTININLKKGDINIHKKYTDINGVSKVIKKKNDFGLLYNIIDVGWVDGYRNDLFWGQKYINGINEITNIFIEKLKINNRLPQLEKINKLYQIIVNFYFDKKGIRPHNGACYLIKYDQPLLKHLKNNDYKFLPSLLEKRNIKNKYLISLLNINSNVNINFEALVYMCRLFGENYIDYIKEFDIIEHSITDFIPKRFHKLSQSEKNNCISILNDGYNEYNILSILYEVLEMKDYLTDKGLDIKFKCKTVNELKGLLDQLKNYKKSYSRRYYITYDFPKHFLDDIEGTIMENGNKFNVFILKTENDFIGEYIKMKNCLNKCFNLGILNVYMSVGLKNKFINLQFKEGKLVEGYGKGNSPIPSVFNGVVDIISEKMKKYSNMRWNSVKTPLIP